MLPPIVQLQYSWMAVWLAAVSPFMVWTAQVEESSISASVFPITCTVRSAAEVSPALGPISMYSYRRTRAKIGEPSSGSVKFST